jgi:cytochrome c
MKFAIVALLAGLAPLTAIAQEALVGDVVAGEEHFNRQCVSCHVVQDEATGEVLAGRNARVGPNLHGVIGRVAGSHPDFDYSGLMETYGGTGALWEEANFVAYVQDPTGYLREATGEASGRSKMAYQVRDEQQAHDLYAYLATFSPEATDGEAASE